MKKLLLAVATLALTLGLAVGVWAATASVTLVQSTPISVSPTRSSETAPAALVRAYYAALDAKNMEVALGLLPDDVALRTLQPGLNGHVKLVEYVGIEQVQRQVESDRTVLSRSIEEMKVDGEIVEYTLREWLNPRMAGMNVTQPAVTQYTARVRSGKIQSITQHTAWE